MLVNVVTAVLAQIPDMIVAGSIRDGDDIASQIRVTRSDVVMIQATQPGNADAFLSLLREFPTLKVVAVAGGASEGFLHELRPHSMRLPDLSAEVLQTALRAVPAPRPH